MAAAKAKQSGAVLKKLVGVADAVVGAAERGKDPTLAIPVRSLANVTFNGKRGIIELGKRKQARTFFNVGMAKKFMQTVLVADALSELQRVDLTTSLREIYYRTKHTISNSHENTLDTQDESDPLIEDLEVTLAALREELHVRAENAGSIVGPLVLTDDGDRVDCARLGRAAIRFPPRRRNICRSRNARRTSSSSSRRAPSGTGSRRTSSGGGTTHSPDGHGRRPAASGGWRDDFTRRRSFRSTSSSTTTRGLLHLLGDQAGLDQPRLREPAHGHPEGEVHGLSSADPEAYGSRATSASSSTTRTPPARASSSLYVVPEEGVAGRDQRMISSGLKYELDALATRLPVPHQEVPSTDAQREDWLD